MIQTAEAVEAARTGDGPHDAVHRAACRDVAWRIGANRVSIWRFADGGESIRCLCFYEADAERFSAGAVLWAADHPRYFATIRTEQVIVAPDARTHPVTAELAEPYFRENDIRSLLDFILHRNFRPAGVICCENAGARRDWRQEDVVYLRQIATLISSRGLAG